MDTAAGGVEGAIFEAGEAPDFFPGERGLGSSVTLEPELSREAERSPEPSKPFVAWPPRPLGALAGVRVGVEAAELAAEEALLSSP